MDKANDSFIECKRIAGDTSSSDIDRENALIRISVKKRLFTMKYWIRKLVYGRLW